MEIFNHGFLFIFLRLLKNKLNQYLNYKYLSFNKIKKKRTRQNSKMLVLEKQVKYSNNLNCRNIFTFKTVYKKNTMIPTVYIGMIILIAPPDLGWLLGGCRA